MALDPVALGLPHRAPFLFIDEVRLHEPGRRAEAVVTFPPETPFFVGHFPGEPIVPGVILTEALAQTAGLAIGQGGRLRLAAIRGMKFPAAAGPGQEILLSASITGAGEAMWLCEVTAQASGQIVASGSVTLAVAT